MTNPYAPPMAAVRDIADPLAHNVAADRGSRLGAAMLDGIIFAGMVYLPLAVGLGVGAAMTQPETSSDAGSAFILGAVLAFVGLVIWSWLTIKYITLNGQSIAKKVMSIKVIRADGSPITLGRLFWLRNFVNGLISIVPFYGLVDVLFIFGESRQCLHDKIADTIVVKA